MPAHSPVEERFWLYVEKTESCWLWVGAMRQNGYGQIRDRGRTLKAHRVSYEMHHGPIPVGSYVLHACDTPACVNPAHLSVGSQRENLRQAAQRERTTRILRACEADAIREAVASGESQRSVSRRLGVERRTVGRVVRGLGAYS